MKAELYINDLTFKYNCVDSLDDVFSKISDFSDLVNHIYNTPTGDVFKVRSDFFYETEIFPDVSLSKLLFSPSEQLKRDYKDIITLLSSKLSRFEEFSCSNDGFISLLSNKCCCNGLVVLNKDDSLIPEIQQIISNIADWEKFHRLYLRENRPDSIECFLDEVGLYFSKISVHEDNKDSMKNIYKTHYKRIIDCLEYLNDRILDDFCNSDCTDFLPFITNLPGRGIFDSASFEGNKKESFNKCFKAVGEKYCEAHLKLNSNDDGKENSFCRIYFSTINKDDEKVYVGIITKHL